MSPKLMDKAFQSADELVRTIICLWPQLEKDGLQVVLTILDILFTPKQLLRQLAIAAGIQTGIILFRGLGKVLDSISKWLSRKGIYRRNIEEQMARAKTYAEWKRYAEELDLLDGLDKWRQEETSTLYDARVLKKRMKDIKAMIASNDVFNLIFRLRGALARDQYGMQHEGLFSRAAAGTKLIVENYHETVSTSLNFICDSYDIDVPTDAKLAFFNETRHSYGRTALLLSGGAFLGYYHMGLVRCLFSEGLLPRVISGASAGSLMAAMVGTRTDEELFHMLNTRTVDDVVSSSIRTDFFSFGWTKRKLSSIGRQFQYLIPQSFRWFGEAIMGLIFDRHSLLRLDTDHLKDVVKNNVGLWTFQEAFDRTGRIINITVAPLNNYDPPRLLNYLTAPHVCVWSAAVASCAIPGVFDSISLIVKEPTGEFRPENEWTRLGHLSDDAIRESELETKQNNSYSDGSIENDLPMQQLSELFNVNHFIVSQVNPHSALLSTMAEQATIWSNPAYGILVGYLRYLKAQCRDWLRNLIDLFVYRSSAPSWAARRGLTMMLTQDYEGRDVDVTIMPWKGHLSAVTAFLSLIKNPSPEEYLEVLAVGEKNTWPFVSRIRAHCSVEMALDKCVQRLRKQISMENRPDSSSGADRHSGGAKLDRTPSFYTSRSIVNLSGLSVSDPIPRPQRRLSRSSSGNYNINSNNNSNNTSSGNLNLGDFGIGLKTKSGSNYDTLDPSIGSNIHNHHVTEEQLADPRPVSGRSSNNSSNSDVSGKNTLREVIVACEDDWDDEIEQGLDIEDGTNNDGTDTEANGNGLPVTGIHKTTNMANFYYKKSRSDEALQS